jgi:hypothetical protein
MSIKEVVKLTLVAALQVTTILKKGLDSKWADLEKIAPLSRLLVHELAHVYTIGGSMSCHQTMS